MGRSDFAERRLSWVENSPAEFDIPQGRRALRGYTRALSKRPVTARMRRFRFIAWLTLFATLYSAASPTLAAVFFADTPAVLGQLLGIPAAAANSTAADQSVSGRAATGACRARHLLFVLSQSEFDRHDRRCTCCALGAQSRRRRCPSRVAREAFLFLLPAI